MKNKKIKITFLGTGANGGIPQLDCRCVNCRSNLNIRNRSSILVETNDKKIIIDCGPDFRAQLMKNNLRLQDLSGVIISHLHWDHCLGLLELTGGKPIEVPVIIHNKLQRDLLKNKLFSFIFKFKFAKFQDRISKIKIEFIKIPHDPNFKTFAINLTIDNKKILIATDIFSITNKLSKIIKKSDLIIFDSTFLNKTKHWHISIKESAPILKHLNNQVIYTHVNHSEKSDKILKTLKQFGFKLAFDEMTINI